MITQLVFNVFGSYKYTYHLLALDSCRPVHPVQLPVQAMCIISPSVLSEWQLALSNHKDLQFDQYILHRIKNGFWVGYTYSSSSTLPCTSNMKSVIDNAELVLEYLQTQCVTGRVVGPFEVNDWPGIQVSRFGVIPKSNQPGKWHLILDLSSPGGRSVNDGIDRELASLEYTSVEQVVERIMQLGKGTLLAKIDVCQAYRNVPVHTDDTHLLGMLWNNQLFVDTVLHFGLRSAPNILRH